MALNSRVNGREAARWRRSWKCLEVAAITDKNTEFRKDGEVVWKEGASTPNGQSGVDGNRSLKCVPQRLDVRVEFFLGNVLERGELPQEDEEQAGIIQDLKKSLKEGGAEGVGGNSSGKDC